jgi:trimethylamine---corrinoid protein Co-methyltransferase
MANKNQITGRWQEIPKQQLDLLHNATIGILANTGIYFNNEEVSDLCKKHGIRTDGLKVFFSENDISKALRTVPSKFTIKARNPEKDVTIGEDSYIFLPSGGAPNIAMQSGEQRPATIEDFRTCCKLVQTSQQLDMVSDNEWASYQKTLD